MRYSRRVKKNRGDGRNGRPRKGRDMELYRRYEENAYFVEMMKLVGHKSIILYEEDGFDHGGMAAPAHKLLMKYIKP